MKLCIFTILFIPFTYKVPARGHQLKRDLSTEIIENAFELFKRGEKYISMSTSENIVAVMGLAGSGKTTLTHFIAGKNLAAYEVPPNSNNYIIMDSNGKITRGVNSNNVFPERIIDNNVVYYDCPGFNDMRSPVDNIAATYFIKNILDRARRVKFIITTTYNSITPGGTEYFKKLLRYVSGIIKNVEKYKNSILLVVTKVENKMNRARNKVNDQNITSEVAGFINSVKENLKDEDFSENSFNLLTTFLAKNGSNYKNIALFRRPENKGPLSSKILKGERNRIKIKVENRLIYTAKSENDFGYEISSESKMMVFKLYEELSQNISQDVSSFVNGIYDYLYEKNNGKKNLHALKEEMESIRVFLSNSLEELKNTSSVENFVIKFIHFTNSFDLKNSRPIFTRLFQKYKFIEFFEKISNERITVEIVEWLHPFSRVTTYVDQTIIWYNFLLNENLHYKLLQNKSNIKEHENSELKTYEIKKLFEETLSDSTGYALNEEISLDENKQRDFRNILTDVLKNNISVICIEPALIIHAFFVSVLEILEVLNHNEVCPYTIKLIKIYALDTLYIDHDIDLSNRSISLVMAAARWKILKSYKINLNGKNVEWEFGDNEDEETAGKNGKDGQSGLPGGSAGHFVGIGQFIQGEELVIHSIGGRAGNGQNGAKGGKGATNDRDKDFGELLNGISTTVEGITKFSIAKNEEVISFIEREIDLYGKVAHYPLYARGNILYPTDTDVTFLLWYGVPGGKGGDGGRGGAGGIGGPAGNISFFCFKNRALFYTVSATGKNGKPGDPGQGGEGGQGTEDLLLKYEIIDYHDLNRLGFENIDTYIMQINSPCFRRFNVGPPGKTSKDLTEPQKPEENKIDQFREFVNFKKHILESKSSVTDNQGLSKFFIYLSNIPEMNSKYDAMELFDEYELFENKADYFTNDEITVYYRLFLDRLQATAVSLTFDQATKLLLNYLYVIALCKIMRTKHTAVNIIDLDTYQGLQTPSEHFSKKDPEIGKMQYISRYEKIVNEKIKQITLFSELHIFPGLDKWILDTNARLKHFINDTINIKRPEISKKNMVLKEKIEDQLKNILGERSLTDSLKYCSILLKILGPLFKVIFDHIKTREEVLSELKLSHKPSQFQDKQYEDLVTLVEIALQLFQESAILKSVAIKDAIGVMSSEIQVPNKIPPLSDAIKQLEETMVEANKYKTSKMTKSIEQLFDMIEKCRVEVDAKKASWIKFMAKSSAEVSSMLHTFALETQLSSVFTDIYLGNKDHKTDFYKIIDVLKNNGFNDNAWLQMSQLNIYRTISSTFVDLLSNLKMLKNENSLQFFIINLKEVIENIKLFLLKFKNYFKSNNIIVGLIERIKDAFNMIESLQEIIEEYSMDKQLSDYIINIESSRSQFANVDSVKLKTALEKLKNDIEINIELTKYNDAIYFFKQIVFPLAHFYDEHIQIQKMKFEKKDLSKIILKKNENLKIKLNNYIKRKEKGLITYITDESFQYIPNSTFPFYTWQQSDHEEIISKFLSGQEIILTAPIEDGLHEKNVIKFKNIELNFRIADETDQPSKQQLKNKSKLFNVTMKHFGNSHFRCDNKFYLLTSPAYAFQYNPQGSSGNKGVGDELPYLLSPFATWSFQLKNVSQYSFGEFQELFKGKVNLELSGSGRYIKSDNNLCFKIRNNYKVLKTISVIDKFK